MISLTTIVVILITKNIVCSLEHHDHLNELSFDSMDYYDQNYVESEELPQPKLNLPEVFCNTHDEFSEDSGHILMTSCSYATEENLHTYQLNQLYLPNERHLRFSYSNIEYITQDSFNSDEPLVIAFNNKVTVLNLQNVNLQSIEPGSFQAFANLEDLNLKNNKLTSIPYGVFNWLNKLMYLDLSQNKLAGYLDWRNLTGLGNSLLDLDLSNNRIKYLRKHAFFNLTGLETLNMNNNKIAILPGALFQHNTFLNNIYFSNNTIAIIGNGTFAYLPKIRNLDVSSNKLLRLPYSVFNATNSSTESITYFNIEDNFLENITETVQNIEINEIFMRENFIKNLTGGKFCDKLDVSRMGLHMLSNISMCNSGSAILASHNELQDLPYMHDVNTVSILELQYNNISSLPAGRFSEFQRLITLRLDKNQLNKIEIGLFTNLDNLKSLNISFNRLEHVNQKVFYGLWQLERLYLGGNQLKTLPAVLILQRLRSLKLLGLNHNPWECSELMDILHVLDMNNVQMAHHVKINYHTTNIGGVECRESHEYKEEKVVKINMTELRITNPSTVITELPMKTTINIIENITESHKSTEPSILAPVTIASAPSIQETVTSTEAVPVADDSVEVITSIIEFIPSSTIDKSSYIPNFIPNSISYTEKSTFKEFNHRNNKFGPDSEYSDHYRNVIARDEGVEIHQEMASMRSSIYEMKAVLIIGTLLIACMICIKLYNFYRKNMKTHIITSTLHENSVQSITTEIEM